jgi:NADPH-dependent glutamate synthase beta subunit-like oxidoreductase/Pyruvate/2-oxoacid:ferredoxin oxidoreductase delta subunit
MVSLAPVDVTEIGKASVQARLSELPALSGKRVAVVGGGPAGISVAWQLRRKGHEAVVYDMSEALGGKIASVIPDSRIPKDVVSAELDRIRQVIPHVHLQQSISRDEFDRLRDDFDFVVVATGATKSMVLPIPGGEKMIPAFDFLVKAKTGELKPGKRVVIVGAGNVGCDAATEAHRLGADDITLIDIQEPASFGKERAAAEAAGAKFRWPVFSEAIVPEGVRLKSGETLPADTVIVAIGDKPELGYLSEDISTERGYIVVNEFYQTSVPKVFAIGDAVIPGLLTDAIGSGRKTAQAICEMIDGRRPVVDPREMIDVQRVSTEYFDPRVTAFDDLGHCGSQCASCGSCRDCGICVTSCPESAISKFEKENNEFEYVVDESRCIGCGFCAGACPCGVWNLVENEPIE